jgi:hypothetical protein
MRSKGSPMSSASSGKSIVDKYRPGFRANGDEADDSQWIQQEGNSICRG